MNRKHLTTLALLLVLVALFVVPLLLGGEPGGRSGGTDDAAMRAIEATHPGYRPWYQSVFEPSGEVESGLFALQAAVGAGVVGYAVGFFRGRTVGRRAAA